MDFEVSSAAFFINILDEINEIGLVDAIRSMEGITYYHGQAQKSMVFKYRIVEPEIQDCLAWACNPTSDKGVSLKEELRHVGEERLAAVRAWTGDVCYVITTLFRDKHRNMKSLEPVLPFMRLFFSGLHKLPSRYLYHGDLYRAEHGARTNWETAAQPGKKIQWFTPLSFSPNPKVLANFMSTVGVRTITVLRNACGYHLKELSIYANEDEVLSESITVAEIDMAEKYGDDHLLVTTGQIKSGLHILKAKAICGFELLGGSPAHCAGAIDSSVPAAVLKLAADRAGLLRSRAEISDKALKELCRSSRPLGNGDRVLIHGVTSALATDFNFKPGYIEKQDANGRFEVVVLKDGMKSSITATLERHNLFSALLRQDRERFLGLVKLRHGSPSLRAALPALLCNLNELLGPVLHISSFFAYPWECLFQFGGFAGQPRDEQWRFTDVTRPIALRKKEDYKIPSLVDPGCVDMGDGRVFFAGGCGGHPSLMKLGTDDFRRCSQIYDALTEEWRKVDEMPTRRHGSVACRIGTKVYVLGGSYPDERQVSDIEKFCDVYDMDSEAWSSIPAEHYKHVRDIDFGKIAFFAAGVLDGRIVVLCNRTADVLAYNPLDGWRKVCKLPEKHDNPCCICYNGELICASGRPVSKGKSCIALSFENSRLAENWWKGSWRDLPKLVLNRVGGSLATVHGKLYITGGFQEDEVRDFTDTAERLDADEWAIVRGFKLPRKIHAHENFTLPHLHHEEGSGKIESRRANRQRPLRSP